MVAKINGANGLEPSLDLRLLKSEGIALRGARADAPEEQKKAAENFEAMLVEQMMKSMWSTIPSEGMLSGSREEQYYRDMLSEAMAGDISKGQGIGIKEVILRELNSKATEK